jgi:hypothetical protein
VKCILVPSGISVAENSTAGDLLPTFLAGVSRVPQTHSFHRVCDFLVAASFGVKRTALSRVWACRRFKVSRTLTPACAGVTAEGFVVHGFRRRDSRLGFPRVQESISLNDVKSRNA